MTFFMKQGLIFFCVLVGLFSFGLVHAAPQSVPEDVIIQDTEIESWLQEVVELCFKKLDIKIRPKVYVLNSRDFNAMATYGGVIIVTTATFAECDCAEQLLGILVHEGGHVAGGHLARAEIAAERATIPMIASTILGGAAALATGNMAPLMMGAAGGSQIAERSMAKHSRSEETNADAAAIRLLGRDAKYLVGVLTKLERKMSLAGVDKYIMSHPLTSERIEAARTAAQQGGEPKISLTESQKTRFMWIKNKVRAYRDKDVLATAYKNPTSDAEQYGKAIALYRQGSTQKALEELKDLIDKHPCPAYVYELLGQIELEASNMSEALKWLNKAHTQLPHAPTINLMFALAIMEGKNKTTLKDPLKKAISLLTDALSSDRENVAVWQLLARAYGEQNRMEHAAACQAQAAYLRGDMLMAKKMAEKGARCADVALAQQCKDLLVEGGCQWESFSGRWKWLVRAQMLRPLMKQSNFFY